MLFLLLPLPLILVAVILVARLRRRRPVAAPIELPDFRFLTYSGLQLDPEHRDCVWLPASFLRGLIRGPEYNSIARLERDYVANIAADIESDGVQEPLIIVVDDKSVCLRDGHHRVVTEVLDYYPVVLERSDRIRKHKVPIGDLLDILWDSAKGKRI